MSPSMWAWRVIVPGLGLSACLLAFYDSTRARSPGPRPSEGVPAARNPVADRIIAEGRLAPRPGAEVTLGSESGGVILALPAREKASVRKGDLLVEFRTDDRRADLAEADARLAEADAEVHFQSGEYQRRAISNSLAPKFRADMDGARRDLEVANARRRVAVAAVDRCRSALDRTRVISPIDGVVLARLAEPGEVALPGARLVTVCDLARTWIEAEVDEFDAARIEPGAPATITAEGHVGEAWKGTVEEVPDRVAERSVRPEDPGRPSDTRVLLVKIALEKPLPLKLGQQVEVEIRPGLKAK